MKASFLFLLCGLAFAASGGQEAYYCEDIKRPFFAASPGSGEYAAQRPFAVAGKFAMPKPAGLKRVFVAGESVAVILGQPGPSRPGAGVEVINCGMSGYESRRVYGVLKEVLAYSPDLIIVLSGNNENFPHGLCPGLAADLKAREFRLLERFYSLKHSPLQARKLASLKMHGAMLKKMARSARAAGVPVVFAALPANLRMPARRPLRFWNARFAAGYKLFYERAYAAAAEEFRLGLAELPEDQLLIFYYAKALEALGQRGEAGRFFLRALDSDPDMDRADTARNALIRQVAAEEGACVADLEKLFRGLAPEGLPGFEQFMDGMHWGAGYNKAVWSELFRSAASCGVKGFENFRAAEVPGGTPREDARRRLNYALAWLNDNGLLEGAMAEFSYIRQASPELFREAVISAERLAKLLMPSPGVPGNVIDPEEVFPLLLLHAGEAERRLGNLNEALALCDRALALRPGESNFRLVRAQVLAGLGRRSEAEKEFLALAGDSSMRELGRAYGFAGARPAGKKKTAL